MSAFFHFGPERLDPFQFQNIKKSTEGLKYCSTKIHIHTYNINKFKFEIKVDFSSPIRVFFENTTRVQRVQYGQD